MAERGRGATDLASLDTRSQELRRQIQEMKAKKRMALEERAGMQNRSSQKHYACWRCQALARTFWCVSGGVVETMCQQPRAKLMM